MNRAQLDEERKDRALFERIAEKYCRKDLVPASRTARKQRLLRTLASLPRKTGLAVLEIGCGAGFSAQYLSGWYERFVGLDYSANLIDYARRHNTRPGAEFVAVNVKDYDSPSQFDVVIMIGVLHHIHDVPAAMLQMTKLLKPGGYLLANEPQPANPLVRAARKVRKRVDNAYSDDQRELSARDLEQMFEAAGLEDVRILPQGVFSTPFAEVVLKPEIVIRPMSAMACAVDTLLETTLGPLLRPLSWNLVASGRMPCSNS
jgi:2-polyprenyl-3-methyl-5-hydroxy-6-metoxy-1,4-benzoquinol methylase